MNHLRCGVGVGFEMERRMRILSETMKVLYIFFGVVATWLYKIVKVIEKNS